MARMDPHEPVTSPYVPKAPDTAMRCWSCEVPRMFAAVHTGEQAHEVDPTACKMCGEGTRLACTTCGEAYKVRTLSDQVREPGSGGWRL